ncbi:unnamed protein product [Brachionus calyciflorus]|uniref:Uncharacterized protein n=1 Tax=Brachionus calyciflorus TaxID=104777 RepID=A0A813SCN4_9BILA|nr:unnamed protein product [Brachionus calyciflorus]
MKVATLGKIALGLAFPVIGMAYMTQNKIAKNFSNETYFKEAVELIKGYTPAMEKLGQPVRIKKIDISDDFNYQDLEKAKVKIPLQGQRCAAEVFAYATKDNNNWKLDYMELKYTNMPKFVFYDSKLVTKSKK